MTKHVNSFLRILRTATGKSHTVLEMRKRALLLVLRPFREANFRGEIKYNTFTLTYNIYFSIRPNNQSFCTEKSPIDIDIGIY